MNNQTESPDRKTLLQICAQASVPEDEWRDRDTSAAQRQLGECYALLKAGCKFHATRERDTYWVTVIFKGFGYFDYDGAEDDERYYLPTQERLDQRPGKDWY